MADKTKYIDYKYLRKFVYKTTSLFRFFILLIFDLLFLLIRFLIFFLFPYIAVIIVGLIMILLKIKTDFDGSVAWGLTGAAVGFLGITVAVLTLVRGINKEYFKVNSLKIFGTYKVFGLYPYYLIWVGNALFSIASIVTCSMEDKSSYSCSISSIIYTLFIIITYLFIFFRNDRSKYVKYLKNSGVLKIKRRSLKMSQRYIFAFKHPKLNKLFSRLNFLTYGDQYALHNRIKTYFNNIYFSRDGGLVNNVNLLKIYFEEFTKYLSTDIDLVLMTDLINAINDNLIDKLKREKEYEILKDILDSMIELCAEVLTSKYFLYGILDNVKFTDSITEKRLGKYYELFGVFSKSIDIHIMLTTKLFKAAINSFEKVKAIKANDKYINTIKKEYLPRLEELKSRLKKLI